MTHAEALRKALLCLKLAESANEHESALAAAKAQQLVDEYKLDVSGINLNADATEGPEENEPIQNFGNDPLESVRNWKSRWSLTLASCIAKLNQCLVYFRRGDLRTEICVVGRPSDVNTVRYLYAYLIGQVEKLRVEAARGHSGAYVRAYCLGVVDSVCMRLRESQAQTFKHAQHAQEHNPQALMCVNRALQRIKKRGDEVAAWMERNMRLKSARATADSRVLTGGRQDGQRDGHKIRLPGGKAEIGRGPTALLS
jgi:hypothetical protein